MIVSFSQSPSKYGCTGIQMYHCQAPFRVGEWLLSKCTGRKRLPCALVVHSIKKKKKTYNITCKMITSPKHEDRLPVTSEESPLKFF